jgi:PAS domain S-box-containing protein
MSLAHPIHVGRSLLRRAFDAAHEAGDLNGAAFNGTYLIAQLLASGDPLGGVQREAEAGLDVARQARFGQVVDRITAQLQLIRTLRGLTPIFGSFNDAGFDEERFERHLEEDPRLAIAACCYWIRKLQACVLADDHAAAASAAAQADRLLWTRPSFFERAEYHFYAALAQAASCDSAAAEERQLHLDDLAAHHEQLQLWAENSPENFENRTALVGAEIARLEGRVLDAEHLYEQAIRSAQANGFIHNEALANELAGRFYAARGFEKIARLYLQDARCGYARWGADGKARQLDQLHPHLSNGEPAPDPTSTIGAPVEHLDLATVIEVSQAVSGEIVLEKLLETLLRIALAQTGAERGLLILARGAEQRIAAEATTSSDTVIVHLRDETATAAAMPESILHYVLRTQESVILEDAAAENPFSADPYIRQHRARSILCLPWTNQATLVGVLYLENSLAPRVFAPARLAVLKLLAAQAATAMENTRLYRELAEREARIRRLVDANIIGIFIWDSEGGILEANDAFLRMVDYNREDLVAGRVRWTDLTPPEWHDRDARAVAEADRTGTIQPFEKEYFRKDGSRVPVLIGVASFDETGNQGVAFVLDLTERKRAEQALRESEERFRTLVQFSFDVYWETDAQHRFIRQEFAERLAEAPAPGSEIGKTRWEVPWLEPYAEAWRKHRETLDAHLPFRDFELARPTPEGGKRYVAVSGLPVFDETGRFIGYRGVGRHITERKRAEQALRESEEQWKAVFESNPTMFFMVEATGAVMSVNPFGAEQLGYTAGDLIGRPVQNLFHEADREAVQRNTATCLEQLGRTMSWELRKVRKDGEVLWVRETARAMLIKQRPVVLVVCEDITERKRAAEALREVQMELAHANRVATMGQLTASIAHEVKQPIAATLTNAQAALRWLGAEPPDVDEVRQALGRIVRDGNRAGDVIGRIRGLIEKAPPRKEALAINEAVREVLAMLHGEVVKHDISMRTRLAEGLPRIQGDRVQLQQVILNLIVNAIEAVRGVDEGARELLVSTEAAACGGVLVAVRDTGPGLDPAHRERLFEAFYTTKPGGLGMGLSICRSIIEAHGGHLWAEANTLRGAIFQFALPRDGMDAQPAQLSVPDALGQAGI